MLDSTKYNRDCFPMAELIAERKFKNIPELVTGDNTNMQLRDWVNQNGSISLSESQFTQIVRIMSKDRKWKASIRYIAVKSIIEYIDDKMSLSSRDVGGMLDFIDDKDAFGDSIKSLVSNRELRDFVLEKLNDEFSDQLCKISERYFESKDDNFKSDILGAYRMEDASCGLL